LEKWPSAAGSVNCRLGASSKLRGLDRVMAAVSEVCGADLRLGVTELTQELEIPIIRKHAIRKITGKNGIDVARSGRTILGALLYVSMSLRKTKL